MLSLGILYLLRSYISVLIGHSIQPLTGIYSTLLADLLTFSANFTCSRIGQPEITLRAKFGPPNGHSDCHQPWPQNGQGCGGPNLMNFIKK